MVTCLRAPVEKAHRTGMRVWRCNTIGVPAFLSYSKKLFFLSRWYLFTTKHPNRSNPAKGCLFAQPLLVPDRRNKSKQTTKTPHVWLNCAEEQVEWTVAATKKAYNQKQGLTWKKKEKRPKTKQGKQTDQTEKQTNKAILCAANWHAPQAVPLTSIQIGNIRKL